MTDYLEMAQTVAQMIAPRAEQADKEAKLPADDVQALQQSGYLALSVPREMGGAGLTLGECVRAQLALAKGSASTALVAGMQLHIFGHQREAQTWTNHWYEQFCYEAVQGNLFNNLASEPRLGSPSRGGLPATTAVRHTDQFIINGQKTWSTGGAHLTHMLVRCAVGDTAQNFLITQKMAGIHWEPTWSDALSLRASDSHDVHFKDVVVPEHHLTDAPQVQKQPNVWYPLMMSAIYLGSALAARDEVIRFALNRVPTALGKPIATLPKIQRQIGELDVPLQAAQTLLLHVADSWTGQNEDRAGFMAQIATAKMMVTTVAETTTAKALQIAGGSSISGGSPLARHFRDVRGGSMQPPSGDTAYELIGRSALGI